MKTKLRWALFAVSVAVSFCLGRVSCQRIEHHYPHCLEFRSLEEVGSKYCGIGGVPGDFYRLARRIRRDGNPVVFRTMLTDDDPIIRVMGVVCLAQNLPSTEPDIESLYGDKYEVDVTMGCPTDSMRVGEFARQICTSERFRDYFNIESEWRPAARPRNRDACHVTVDENGTIMFSGRARSASEIDRIMRLERKTAGVRAGQVLPVRVEIESLRTAPPEALLGLLRKLAEFKCAEIGITLMKAPDPVGQAKPSGGRPSPRTPN